MRQKSLQLAFLNLYILCLCQLPSRSQPVITTQPGNRLLSKGATATFSVAATGTASLSYQWLFDGAVLTNATNSVLSLPNPPSAEWGYYSVIISNSSGAVTSTVVELKEFATAPHSLNGIEPNGDGTVTLSFAGETAANLASYFDIYPVESSSNLINWTPLVTLQRTNTSLDTLHYVDADATNFNQRFYRTAEGPFPTPDPAPTGPYPVGTFSMVVTNTLAGSRHNAKFMVTFWYPATPQTGVLPTKYVEPQFASSGIYNIGSVGGGNFGPQAAAFSSHSFLNAPIATNGTRYPVALYDPGDGGYRRENTDKAEELASWGYVVVGLDTGDTTFSVLPNGTLVAGQSNGGAGSLQGDVEGRVLDLQFVLDDLPTLNTNDTRLAARLDLDSIGAFGWSLGGCAAAQLCFRDPRCKAGAGFDAGFLETNLLTQPLSVPFLYFRSDAFPQPDQSYYAGSYCDGAILDDRLEAYNGMSTNAYWVKLASTVHGSFMDYNLVLNPASLEAGYGLPMSGQVLTGARTSQIVRAYLLSFFDKFFKRADDHLLDGPSSEYPEVLQFLSTPDFSVSPKYPTAALVEGLDGNFYGTTQYGGANGDGAVFQVTTNGELTTMVSFNGTNGCYPFAGLTLGADGNFYGVTEHGGTNGNYGSVFAMTPTGALTSLVSFNGKNGSYPAAGLALGTNGNLYGATASGGANGVGTVFQMTPSGVLTTLASFNKADGAVPIAALVQGTNGDFYGATFQGGDLTRGLLSSGVGAVFQLTPSGTLTARVVFDGPNGEYPAGRLIEGADGYFYGTTSTGGNAAVNVGYGFGTVFKLSVAGGLTKLVSFGLTNGYNPSAGLTQGSDGNMFGTTLGGGAGGGGTVFQVTTNGVLTTLVTFNGANGSHPQAALFQATDGNFYGTTTYGGANGFGTVFKVTPAGVLTTLVSF